MNILGLSGGVKIGNQDGAAALLVDGQLAAAAEEERFSGTKFANGQLPRHAIRYCLREAGLTIGDIDAAVFAGATYENFEEILTSFFEFNFGAAPRVFLADHHTCHAASTYFGSGWDDALVVTADFSGDRKSTTVHRGRGGRLEVLEEIERPNSLGIYYSAVTQFLGFQRDSDEYKVMGMAAYGRPHIDFSHVLQVTDSGYRFDASFIRGISDRGPSPSKQERLFKTFPAPCEPRVPGSPIEQIHYDVAASAQAQLERAMVRLVEHHLQNTGATRVCVAGGVALNCLMNQRLRELPQVAALYAPPVCSDAGLALGAAYLHAVENGERVSPLEHAYWGPEFTAGEIREVLDRAGLTYEEVGDPAAAAVERILDGEVVGWFQGRLEYGPRALGNRSILADPRRAEMKDLINAKVKFREEFRPVAPAVLHAHGGEYFVDYADSPYMTQTFRVAGRTESAAPAIVHADRTSRLQSVHASTNPLFADLIEQFQRASGLPMVLNTSLNSYNDPMACEPHHALRTLFATGLDSLVMGPFVLDKGKRKSGRD